MFNDNELNLLLDLFHLYAPSNGEKPVLEFIKKVLTDNNINFNEDKNGNIYCLNHLNAPLLSSHTDCVGTAESGRYVNLVDIYPYKNDKILKGIGNIGGDDKCGVFLILLLLLKGIKVNAFFSICEEIGGGNGICHLLTEIEGDEIFKSCPYCLVLDRRNNGDIICNENNYGSKPFENELAKIGIKYGYKPTKGLSCDMDKIKNYMNGCNLSVGYYNPHSSTEFVSLNDLYNTFMYVNDVVENLPRDIEFVKPVTHTYTYSNGNYYYNGSHYNGNYYNGNYHNNYKKNTSFGDEWFYD